MTDTIIKCVCQHCSRVTVVPQENVGAVTEELRDKIEGLEADLDSAVETAFKRGAVDWVRLNYPAHYARLTTA